MKLPQVLFKEQWLDDANVRDAIAQRDIYNAQISELMTCLCDACATYRGVSHCELCGDCSFKMAEHLLALGVTRTSYVVSEAFNELTRMLKRNVTGQNVDYYSEVKCYMVQIENDYIKRCYPGAAETEEIK